MRFAQLAICVLLLTALVWGFDTPYRGATAPIAIYKVEPQYTQAARDAGLEGQVWLSVVIDEKGIPTEMSVLRSLGLGLDEKAIEAAKKWRFKPGLKDGVPTAVKATIAISFRLSLAK